MAPFSAKRKGRQSFAPRFRLSAESANQKNAWKTTFNIARLLPPVALGREVLKRGAGRAYFCVLARQARRVRHATGRNVGVLGTLL